MTSISSINYFRESLDITINCSISREGRISIQNLAIQNPYKEGGRDFKDLAMQNPSSTLLLS